MFETGYKSPVYNSISIYADAPNNERQITFGSQQTTSTSGLPELIQRYEKEPNRKVSFEKYINRIGDLSLVDDDVFLSLLKQSGNDPVMWRVQDAFFDDYYFKPAYNWFAQNGFTLPLSMLIIMDSYIHSGGVRSDIRAMFSEVPPIKGGKEKVWCTEYVNARRYWLANHKRTVLHDTVYRMDCFIDCIKKNNWFLDDSINANGVII